RLLDVGKVEHPAAVGPERAGDVDLHHEGVAVQARALVAGWHVGQAVCRLEAEGLEDFHAGHGTARPIDAAVGRPVQFAAWGGKTPASACRAKLGRSMFDPHTITATRRPSRRSRSGPHSAAVAAAAAGSTASFMSANSKPMACCMATSGMVTMSSTKRRARP